MKKSSLSAIVSTAIICFLFWLVITGQLPALFSGSFSVQSLVIGACVSTFAGWFSSRFFINNSPWYLWNPARLLRLFAYFPIFFVELVKANMDVARRALSPKPKLNPGIVKVPVDVKSDYGMALVADSITLTPGTVTMDITEQDEQTYYYIHWIDVASEDPVEAGDMIKGIFERKVKGIWG